MANSITAQTSPVPIRGATYGSINYYNITLDTSAQNDTIAPAPTNAKNCNGLVYAALQNNSGANAITIQFKSGTDIRYQKVLAVAAELLLPIQTRPHVICDPGKALIITGTGTSPVVAGVAAVAVAPVFEL